MAPAGEARTIPSVTTFRDRMHDMLSTVWHEAQHAGQHMLKAVRGLKDLGGLPSWQLRDLDATASGHKKLPSRFNRRTLRRTLLRLPSPMRLPVFKEFVAQVDGDHTSPRITRLKQNAPAKWEAVVRLLGKNVSDLL